jgi:hypothetical protein
MSETIPRSGRQNLLSESKIVPPGIELDSLLKRLLVLCLGESMWTTRDHSPRVEVIFGPTSDHKKQIRIEVLLVPLPGE